MSAQSAEPWAHLAVEAVRCDSSDDLKQLLDDHPAPVLVSLPECRSAVHLPILLLDLSILHHSNRCSFHLFNERRRPGKARPYAFEEDDSLTFTLTETNEEECLPEESDDLVPDANPLPASLLDDLVAELAIPDSVTLSGWLSQSAFTFTDQPQTGFEAFYLAANHDRPDLVAHMLDHGCDATQISRFGTTVFNGLVLKRNFDLLELFFEREIPVSPAATGRWPLHCAVKRHDGELIELLMENTYSDPNCCDRRGDTPLHLAAKLGLPGICELLTDFGADVDLRNRAGFAPLHVAAAYGQTRVVEALHAAGADLLVNDALGRTALNLAWIRKKKACVKFFVEQGLTNDNMTEVPMQKKKFQQPEKGTKRERRKARELVKKLR
jgi:ankyrin repeat protein